MLNIGEDTPRPAQKQADPLVLVPKKRAATVSDRMLTNR
jgi:hypothetical protein